MKTSRQLYLSLEENEEPMVIDYDHVSGVGFFVSEGNEGMSIKLEPCELHIKAVKELLAALESGYERQQSNLTKQENESCSPAET